MRNLPRAAIVAAIVGVSLVRPAAEQQQPVFRASTHYVAVDVVVTDRDDQPVTDLTRDDFEIVAGGRRQVIVDFAFVRVPLAHRAIDVDAPPSPPGDVASNGESARASRAIVILVDDSSLSEVLFCDGCPDVMMALKSALTRFLQSLSPDDQVAILWQGRSDLSQDFTNDIPRLIAAVNNRKAAMGLHAARHRPWRPRLNSLKFAVNALAGSHVARRAIVFVGAAACNPISVIYFEGEECRDLYKRAREANVPIYTLDPRVNPPGMSDNMVELSINTGGLSFQRQSQAARRRRQDPHGYRQLLLARVLSRSARGGRPVPRVQGHRSARRRSRARARPVPRGQGRQTRVDAPPRHDVGARRRRGRPEHADPRGGGTARTGAGRRRQDARDDRSRLPATRAGPSGAGRTTCVWGSSPCRPTPRSAPRSSAPSPSRASGNAPIGRRSC